MSTYLPKGLKRRQQDGSNPLLANSVGATKRLSGYTPPFRPANAHVRQHKHRRSARPVAAGAARLETAPEERNLYSLSHKKRDQLRRSDIELETSVRPGHLFLDAAPTELTAFVLLRL